MMDSMQGDPMTWQPQPQPQPVDPPKRHRARRLLAFAAVALGAFLIGLGAGGAGKSSTVTSAAPATTVTAPAAPAQTTTVTVAPAPPAPPPGPATKITKDGVYVVGTDIAAGKWKTTGPRAGTPGYFAVLKDPAASASDVGNIVTNDNPNGQAFVTLKAGQGFATQRLDWEKVG